MRRRLFVLGSAAYAFHNGSPASLTVGGKEAARFYYGPEWDKPFLYPLLTASGKTVSRGFPVETRPGESNDHPWHRGLWWGHGDINGHDFWRERGREITSRIVVTGQPVIDKGAIGIEAGLVTPANETLGTVAQTWRISGRGALRFIDARIAIQAGDRALKFGDTEDGGFAFRLSDDFREDRGARLLNSEGRAGADAIWGRPARWVDYSATLDGKPCGVVMFDHPGNLRHPTRWHARNYSLNAANPFALRSFTKDKSKDGTYTLAAGAKLSFRYRVVIHEGTFDEAAIEREYKTWAESG